MNILNIALLVTANFFILIIIFLAIYIFAPRRKELLVYKIIKKNSQKALQQDVAEIIQTIKENHKIELVPAPEIDYAQIEQIVKEQIEQAFNEIIQAIEENHKIEIVPAPEIDYAQIEQIVKEQIEQAFNTTATIEKPTKTNGETYG